MMILARNSHDQMNHLSQLASPHYSTFRSQIAKKNRPVNQNGFHQEHRLRNFRRLCTSLR